MKPRSAGHLYVEAAENPFLIRKTTSEWRDPYRAICHFTVGVIESPSRQRRLLSKTGERPEA
jgi:hypothetical protein